MGYNVAKQQNVAPFEIVMVAFRARSIRLSDTRPLMPELLDLLPTLRPGTLRLCLRAMVLCTNVAYA
ncbi:MAG TPA: hypothetical protein VGI60_03270 [Chthoniobacterales bacterium]